MNEDKYTCYVIYRYIDGVMDGVVGAWKRRAVAKNFLEWLQENGFKNATYEIMKVPFQS